MNTTTAQTPGALARLAYEFAIDPHATPQDRQDAADHAATAYAATLGPSARAALAAENARQGLAGQTHPRHFDKAWR